MADLKALQLENKVAKETQHLAEREWKLQCEKEDRQAQKDLRAGQGLKAQLKREGEGLKAKHAADGLAEKERLVGEGQATRAAFLADGKAHRLALIREGEVEKERLSAETALHERSVLARVSQVEEREAALVCLNENAQVEAREIIDKAHRDAKRIKVDRLMDFMDAEESPFTLADYAGGRSPVIWMITFS